MEGYTAQHNDDSTTSSAQEPACTCGGFQQVSENRLLICEGSFVMVEQVLRRVPLETRDMHYS